MKNRIILTLSCMRAPSLGVLCLAVLTLGAISAQAQAGKLEEASMCTDETQRLERLACFDEVFGTPLAEPETGRGPSDSLRNIERSTRWREAYAQAETDPATGGAHYRNTGQAAGLLVTVPALGAKPPRPLLALQCHNNITELTLMLPEPLDAERVSLSFGVSETVAQSAWRVRDNGYVLSIGRGLPAIRAVKVIGPATDIRGYSGNNRIDGLLFDLTGVGSAIRTLRESCSW